MIPDIKPIIAVDAFYNGSNKTLTIMDVNQVCSKPASQKKRKVDRWENGESSLFSPSAI
jgi:hypothetical protein